MTGTTLQITGEIETLIDLAIHEDIADGDITSEAIFPSGNVSTSRIVARDSGIICGLPLVREVYRRIDTAVTMEPVISEGGEVTTGDEVARFSGPTASLLKGERIILNFMQRMSGIATATARLLALMEGTEIRILDTRKTLPGFRILDKYAVKLGGGTNHRMGLFDMVMIKDNHIRAAGSIGNAVTLIRKRWGTRYKIEVEATTLTEVEEAIEAKSDIIMLDNMDNATMEKAVAIINGDSEIEVSGNMTEERIREIRHIKIDYISVGALTHSVAAFDLSMKFN